MRDIFNAKDRLSAEERLQKCVEKYSKSAPQLAEWIEENIPEGLTVFALPGKHRRRMRTTNMLERLHEEIKRRTRVARLFVNEASLLRLVSAIEMEISEEWIADKRYLDLNVQVENDSESANSKEKEFTEKMLLDQMTCHPFWDLMSLRVFHSPVLHRAQAYVA